MNNVVEKFKKGRNIQLNKSPVIRKMQTAAGGPIRRGDIKRQKDGFRYIPDGKGGWTRISDNNMSDVFATMEFTPKRAISGSSITRHLQEPSKTYYSAYNPDDIIKGFNALTLGGLNNLSPTQWARRYYDLNQLLASLIPGSKRTMTWSGFVNNWLNGNKGLVSERFAQEHPYWSIGINGVGDAVALGGLANANKIKLAGDIVVNHGGDAAKFAIDVAKNSSKPFNWKNYRFLGDSRFYSDLDDAGYKTIMAERLSGNYPLTFAERRNYITGLKGDIQKGVDYAIDEAKTNLKTPLKLGKEIEYTFNGGKGWRLDPYSPEDILPLKIYYGTLKAINSKSGKVSPWEGHYGAFLNNNGLFFPFRDRVNSLRTNSVLQDVGERIGTGAHETRHTIQSYFDTPLTEIRYDMPGSYGRYTNRELPLDFKKKVNSFISDAETAGEWEGSLSEMDAELTGWRALYNLPRYSEMNPKQKALLYDLFLKRFGGNTDYNESAFHLLDDSKTLNPYAIKREVKNLDNSQIGQIILGLEVLGYRKNGGKMNILEFLKKGSGIHIKKENRGKFTDYCGGTVTDECIRRGKNSSSATIRKRATFAANARKWKHKKGGKAFVEGVNVLDSNPDAYKYVKKKYKMRSAAGGSKVDWGGVANTIGGLSNSIMNIAKTFKNQKAIDLMKEANASMLNAYKNQAINNAYNDALNSESDKSDIVNRFNAYHKAANSASQIVALKLRELDLQVAQAEQANAAAQLEAWTGAIKDLSGLAINALNKKGMTLKAANSNDSMFSKNTNINGTNYKTFNTPIYKTFNDWADANVHNKIGTVDSNGFMNLQLGKTDMNGMLLKLSPIKTNLFNYKLNI